MTPAHQLVQDDDASKPRSRLSREQTAVLKRIYAETYFPDKHVKDQLSRDLHIPIRTIQIWFQNQRQYHRLKLKKRANQKHQAISPGVYQSQSQQFPSLLQQQYQHSQLSTPSLSPAAAYQHQQDLLHSANPRRNSAPARFTDQHGDPLSYDLQHHQPSLLAMPPLTPIMEQPPINYPFIPQSTQSSSANQQPSMNMYHLHPYQHVYDNHPSPLAPSPQLPPVTTPSLDHPYHSNNTSYQHAFNVLTSNYNIQLPSSNSNATSLSLDDPTMAPPPPPSNHHDNDDHHPQQQYLLSSTNNNQLPISLFSSPTSLSNPMNHVIGNHSSNNNNSMTINTMQQHHHVNHINGNDTPSHQQQFIQSPYIRLRSFSMNA